MSDRDPQLLQLFHQNGGYLTPQDLKEDTYFNQLKRWVQQGKAQKVHRGVYRLTDSPLLEHEELLELQLRFPHIRYCLISALYLHGLTTTQPLRVQFAIPHHRTFPGVDHPPVEVYHFQDRHYQPHQTELTLSGTTRTLKLYTKEKTLCDLHRYQKKLGRDLYLEGLKKYLRHHKSPRQLIKVAREQHLDHKILTDLEVLLYDIDT